jgi:hypothetical protein
MPLPASAPDSKTKKNTKEIETYLIEEIKINISLG